MNSQILQNIESCMIELSDVELQRNAWSGKLSPEYESSYIELVNKIFDDCAIEYHMNNLILKGVFNLQAFNDLQSLIVRLKNYNPTNIYAIEEIINDDGWQDIVKNAKIVLNQWDKIKSLLLG